MLKTIKLFLPLVTISVLSACTTPPLSTTVSQQEQRDLALQTAIIQFTKQPNINFSKAFVDLNENHKNDAIVLLRDRNWCGSGGCTLLIFEKQHSKYKLISQSTVTDAPIYALNTYHQGWRDLAVYSRKRGFVRFKYDGQRYPSNPSILNIIQPFDERSARLLISQQ